MAAETDVAHLVVCNVQLHREVVAALREGRVRAAAVGDTTAAPLRAYGIEPLVPERFRLGALVKLVIAELGRDAS